MNQSKSHVIEILEKDSRRRKGLEKDWSCAFVGKNWFVMVNTPSNNGQDWDDIIQQTKKNILSKLNRILKTDIAPLIISEDILDPVRIESKTASFKGSLYGAASNKKMAAFFRHANFSKDISGLFFCGGSVHPGGGIPLALSSAKIVDGFFKHS